METSNDKYEIIRTVWRSGRKNDFGDELVVTQGNVNLKLAYIMAWEVNENRPECVCWNGTVAYFPRMFWLDSIPKNFIKVYNHSEEKHYLIEKDKHYTINEDGIYVKYNKEEGTDVYQPQFINVTKNPSALTQAIEYVLWFNENQRQLDTYNRLLSTSKQARKRRRNRASKTVEKQINTTL